MLNKGWKEIWLDFKSRKENDILNEEKIWLYFKSRKENDIEGKMMKKSFKKVK